MLFIFLFLFQSCSPATFRSLTWPSFSYTNSIASVSIMDLPSSETPSHLCSLPFKLLSLFLLNCHYLTLHMFLINIFNFGFQFRHPNPKWKCSFHNKRTSKEIQVKWLQNNSANSPRLVLLSGSKSGSPSDSITCLNISSSSYVDCIMPREDPRAPSLWLYSPLDLGRFFSFLIYTQSVGLLGRGISTSQVLDLLILIILGEEDRCVEENICTKEKWSDRKWEKTT
jgi:hypothetical protein